MCRLLLGEAFVEVTEDYATEYCERKQEQLQARVEELGAEKERITSRQQVRAWSMSGRGRLIVCGDRLADGFHRHHHRIPTTTLQELKKALYGRFGGAINLEEK